MTETFSEKRRSDYTHHIQQKSDIYSSLPFFNMLDFCQNTTKLDSGEMKPPLLEQSCKRIQLIAITQRPTSPSLVKSYALAPTFVPAYTNKLHVSRPFLKQSQM